MASSNLQTVKNQYRFFIKSIVIVLFFTLSPALYSHTPEFAAESSNSSSGRSRSRALTEVAATARATQCSSVHRLARAERCSHARQHCGGSSRGLFNYASLHFCHLDERRSVSVTVLVGAVVLQFYAIATAAELHFSAVVGRMAALLRLSPSMGGVTLLALGNGAPDVFASIAAVGGDNARIGLGAILSAGTFVSALVVGFVALTAAPFAVKPSPFIRDVFFYMVAATTLFYIYLTGVIFLWQAVGLVMFYVMFVAVVFWMDRDAAEGKSLSAMEMGVGFDGGGGFNSGVRVEEGFDRGNRTVDDMAYRKQLAVARASVKPTNFAEQTPIAESRKTGWRYGKVAKLTKIWEVPVKLLLKLTIPSIRSTEWSRFYASANIVLCPLALLYFCSSFIPYHYPVVFLIPNVHFPLWMVVLAQSCSIGVAHYLIVSEPPDEEQKLAVVVAFVMSVCWISFIAGELLGCLAALGVILKLSPALLGLTVLAWGNSIGDLVADVAVAKAGQPAMAMAGCYAGPMFNMLIGLGLALVMRTAHSYPSGYYLHFHMSIVVAFGFLFLSLLGSLFVVTWSRFQVPRFWGFFLIALYVLFVVVSLMIANIT